MNEIEEIQDSVTQLLAKAGDSSLVFLLTITGKLGEICFLTLLQTLGELSLKKIQIDTNNTYLLQEELLLNILNLQKNTDYGRKFNFATLRSIEQFKKNHPLTTYKDYQQTIDIISSNGDFAKLVAEPITLFQETSGTTGKSKLIPRTNRLSLSFMEAFQAVDALSSSSFSGNIPNHKQLGMALIHTFPVKYTPCGIPQGTGTSGGFQDSLKKFELVKKIIDLKFSSPPSVFLIPDSEIASYCHLLFGLQTENLTFISANFASSVLEAAQILETKWEQLLDDLSLGQINQNIDLDEDIRSKLQNLLRPNPERAKAIRQEIKKGTQGIFSRIWRNLTYLQCITTGSMAVYKQNLKHYVGEIPIYSGAYGASESWVGVNLHPYEQSPKYTLLPRSAFFEFIPIENIDDNQPTTIDPSSLQVGESYEVVITTFAGLYRYRLGDIVKAVGYYNQSPTLEFLYRRGSLLNLAGEKVSESTITTAILEAKSCLAKDCRIIDYTTYTEVLSRPWKYVVYIEMKETSEILPNLEQYRDNVEAKIFEINEVYLALREANTIGALKVKLVKKDTFKKFKNEVHLQKGSDGQFKMPRLLKKQEHISFIENMVLAQSH